MYQRYEAKSAGYFCGEGILRNLNMSSLMSQNGCHAFISNAVESLLYEYPIYKHSELHVSNKDLLLCDDDTKNFGINSIGEWWYYVR